MPFLKLKKPLARCMAMKKGTKLFASFTNLHKIYHHVFTALWCFIVCKIV
jgi:hypothetical protein